MAIIDRHSNQLVVKAFNASEFRPYANAKMLRSFRRKTYEKAFPDQKTVSEIFDERRSGAKIEEATRSKISFQIMATLMLAMGFESQLSGQACQIEVW